MQEISPKERVSVIIPTIGRAVSLRRTLDSLCHQSFKVHEVVISDGSSSDETARLASDGSWLRAGLRIRWAKALPPNAVRQRKAAIADATGEYLLLLDDDVVLESDCLEQMMTLLRLDEGAVAVFGNFSNQPWPMPTRAWRLYLRYLLGMPDGTWQGKVVGPLLRFAYNPIPKHPMPIDWIGAGNSIVRRSAYEHSGGFSDFFLRRCTTNEDVDLGLKLSRIGRILFCPTARMSHLHAGGGRLSRRDVAEDDLYNRFLVMRRTQHRVPAAAFGLVLLYFLVETTSGLVGCARRLSYTGFAPEAAGRLRALGRILMLASQGS